MSGEIAVVEGDRTTIGVRGKPPLVPPFRETGRFWPSPFGRAEDEELTALARSAVAALGIRTGITRTELEVTPQGPRLIEVNGRLGGGIQELSLSAMDLDLTGYAARIALGETTPPRLVPVEGVHFQLILLAPRRSCEVVATDAVGVVGGVVPDHDAYVAPVERINSSVRRGFAFEGEPSPASSTAPSGSRCRSTVPVVAKGPLGTGTGTDGGGRPDVTQAASPPRTGRPGPWDPCRGRPGAPDHCSPAAAEHRRPQRRPARAGRRQEPHVTGDSVP
ncbi:hypothetical protein ACGFYY_33855 [Streptomyces sp. NPDC048331]|uniref:hypothetical protein n=1 Tax=Streptomyces sp. NPDC048331 TaxID=3365534 RepID=UPI0037207E2F